MCKDFCHATEMSMITIVVKSNNNLFDMLDTCVHLTTIACFSYLLNSAMNADFVPLIVIESDLIGLDLHVLFTVSKTHTKSEEAMFQSNIEIASTIT